MLKQNNRKIDYFKLHYWHDALLVGVHMLPLLVATQFTPYNVISFNERNSVAHPEDHWLDFFIDDYLFECFWGSPSKYLARLRPFAGIITPDFSMLPDMLPDQRAWNCARNRIMAYYLQKEGLNIIPTASWCDEQDFEWCFDGLPENSSIAVSTNGCKSSPYSKRVFLLGVEELQERKRPSRLIVCGKGFEELSVYGNVVYYPSFSDRLRRRINDGK